MHPPAPPLPFPCPGHRPLKLQTLPPSPTSIPASQCSGPLLGLTPHPLSPRKGSALLAQPLG